MIEEDAAWGCPRCRSPANEHTVDRKFPCGSERSAAGGACMGFICECPHDTSIDHGTPSDPCPNAVCYHCGWGGTFPAAPVKLKGWARKAWDAGWRPPAGWSP